MWPYRSPIKNPPSVCRAGEEERAGAFRHAMGIRRGREETPTARLEKVDGGRKRPRRDWTQTSLCLTIRGLPQPAVNSAASNGSDRSAVTSRLGFRFRSLNYIRGVFPYMSASQLRIHHLENPQPLYSLEKTSCSTECARRRVHRMAPDVAQGSADFSEGFAVLGSPVHLI